MDKALKLRDVVVAKKDDPLHCGTGIYTHAICVNVDNSDEPHFVSEECDMVWYYRRPDSVIPLCQVHPDIFEKCYEHYHRTRRPMGVTIVNGVMSKPYNTGPAIHDPFER